MTLRQIGGAFDGFKTSGIYDLSDAELQGRALENVSFYKQLANYNKFWTSNEVTEQSFIFSDDGLKAWIYGDTNLRVAQYKTSTPFNVAGLVPDVDFLSLSTQSPSTFALGDNGTKLYAANSSNFYQWNLTTAYDVTSSTLVNTIAATALTAGASIFFKPDGTKLFSVGTDSRFVNVYNLSTAWDISTAVYSSTEREEWINTIRSITFNPDGTRLYIGDASAVTRLDLSTAWDLLTAKPPKIDIYDLLVPNANAPTGVAYGDNGAYCLTISDNGSLTRLTLGTAYRANNVTAYTTATAQVSGVTTGYRGLHFKPDGTKYYTTNSNGSVYQFALSTAWDISTAAYENKRIDCSVTVPLWVGASTAVPTGVSLSDDGLKCFLVDDTGDRIYELELATAWDLSTATFIVYKGNQVHSPPVTSTDVVYSNDGTKYYVLGGSGAPTVYQYTLSPAWDVRTATNPSKTFSFATQETNPQGLAFKSDGTKMYVVGQTNKTVYQYALSTAWDVSTATYETKSFSVNTQETLPTGVCFGDSGTKMYAVGTTNDTIYQYTLSTAWEVNTASYASKSYSPGVGATPQGIRFSPDGITCYMLENTSDVLRQIRLQTAWDIASVKTSLISFSFAKTVNGVSTLIDTDFTGFDISSDGKQFIFMGNVSDRIIQFNFPTAYDVANFKGARIQGVGNTNITRGASLSSNGSNFYYVDSQAGFTRQSVTRVTLNTPNSLGTGTSSSTKYFYTSFYSGLPRDVAIANDGTQIAVINDRWLFVFELTTAYSITSVELHNYTTGGFGFSSLAWRPDGLELYCITGTTVSNAAYPDIRSITFSSPFDIRVATGGIVNVQSFNPYTGTTNLGWWDLLLGPGGNYLILLSNYFSGIFKYRLATAYDLNTLFNSTWSFGLGTSSIRLADSGSKLWLLTSSGSLTQYNLPIPWDIGSRTLRGSFGMTAQGTTFVGLAIAKDGKKVYIAEDSTDRLYEYQMVTAFDILTMSFFDAYIPAAPNMEAVAFSTDGTKMFTMVPSATIRRYDLATAWDVKTATDPGISASYSPDGTTITDLKFSSDGTSMYLMGSGSLKVYEYYLPVAWDPRNAYQSQTVSTASQGSPLDYIFGDSGTKLYALISGTVYQYNLSTAYDVTSLSYANKTFFIGGNQNAIFFNPTGTRLFVVDDDYNKVRQYTLNTAWDISTTRGFKTRSVSSQAASPVEIRFKPDGTKMYILDNGTSSDYIWQYSLSTAWDITTATYDSKSLYYPHPTTFESSANSFDFSADGTKIMIAGELLDNLYTYNLSTAWDISTKQDVYTTKSFSGTHSDAKGMTFKSDGTVAWLSDDTNDRIYQYNLTTPWDISTLTYAAKSFYYGNQTTSSYAVELSSDGTRAYVLGDTEDRVFNYDLTTPYDISTARVPYQTYSVSGTTSTGLAITFSADGLKMYSLDQWNDRVYQYNLTTAWDLSTASSAGKSVYVGTQDATPVSVDISSDGTKFYVLGNGNDTIYQYNMTTAYDASTATYASKSLFVQSQDTEAYAIRVSSDGLKLVMAGRFNDRYYIYNLSTAFELNTASYSGTNFSIAEASVGGIAIGKGPTVTEGVNIYATGDAIDSVHHYTHSTAFIGPQSLAASRVFSYLVSNPRDIYVSHDGLYLFLLNDSQTIYRFKLAAAYDIASIDFGSYSIVNEEGSGQKVRFSSDGTRMLVMGQAGDDITIYTLSTPWIPSTVVSVTTSGYVNEGNPTGFYVRNTDGLRYYICGLADVIREFIPSTAYGGTLTTSSTQNVAPLMADPRDIYFSADGTKCYLLLASTIWQFKVDAPFSVSSIDTGFYNVTSQETALFYCQFSSDGHKVLFGGTSGDNVRRLTLAHPYNLSSVTSVSGNLALSGLNGETYTTGIWYKPDGTRMFSTGHGTDRISQYSATNYESLTLTSSSCFIGDFDFDPYGLTLSTDGKFVYWINGTTIKQAELDTAWEINSTYLTMVPFASTDSSPQTVFIGDSGTKFYYTGQTGDILYQHAMPYPWNCNAMTTFASKSLTEFFSTGMEFSPDGTKFWIFGDSLDRVQEYEMSTPWSIASSGSELRSAKFDHISTSGWASFRWNADGTRLTASNGSTIYQRFARIPYRADSVYGYSYNVGSQESTPRGVCFNGDGTRMYVAGQTGDDINQYNLSVPWAIGSSSYSTIASFSTFTSFNRGLHCNANATKFWLIDTTLNRIGEFNNSGTGGNLGSLTLVSTYSPGALESTVLGVFLGDSGNGLYFTGTSADRVQELNLGTSETMSTYDPKSISIASQTTAPIGLEVSISGSKLYVMSTSGGIYQYDFTGTSRSVKDLTYKATQYIGTIASGPADPTDIFMSPSGKSFYILDRGADKVFEYRIGLF
jgi:6-phosphogluconolactonase (cycloisomerase 2 family)